LIFKEIEYSPTADIKEIQRLVEEAETRSEIICQICGGPGKEVESETWNVEEFNVAFHALTNELSAKYMPKNGGKALIIANKGNNSAGLGLVRIEVWSQEVIWK